MKTCVDGNNNRVMVRKTGHTFSGRPLVVVQLVDEPARGYVALVEEFGGFGDDACPSSWGRPCLGWFGRGERYHTAEQALDSIG